MEDYKEKYKQALEKAKTISKTYINEGLIQVLENIFPELKESEDERIRKELINFFSKGAEYDSSTNGIKDRNIIAWLEKQGEQTPTDNVEPKFKVGDWVIYELGEYSTTLQIKNIVDGTYEFTDNSTLNVMDENTLRLWTIQDAKAGDVLYYKSNFGIEYIVMSSGVNKFGNIDSYFRYNSDDGFGTYIPSVFNAKSDDITPATKEQRDFLFQKMKEAGYEWDVEKKELKKIEQKPIEIPMTLDEAIEHCKEKSCDNSDCASQHQQLAQWLAELKEYKKQKPAWSEEDENYCLDVNAAVSDYYFDEGYAEELKDWLKSLKERVQPQPKQEWSEVDKLKMDTLIHVINNQKGSAIFEGLLPEELVNWLKSIKERMKGE